MAHWQKILPGVWRFPDSCNVYAVEGPGGMLVIDAGTGAWLGAAGELPRKIAALACTHFFRDHSAGALAATKAGIPVYVPEGERAIFAHPLQHFRERETYIIYDNNWDSFAPIQGIPVAGVLRDYERSTLAGLEIDVVPLPGATITQIGLAIKLPGDGRRVVFSAEAIHSPGRLARVAPLQYNYNDLPGAVLCYLSAQTLRDLKPAALLPSFGEPILQQADEALVLLKKNLRTLVADRAGATDLMNLADPAPLVRVSDHVWQDARSFCISWYLLSRSGKVLTFDYGYHCANLAWPNYARPRHRRPLLHGLDALKNQFGIDKIDTVLVSHFHDDHVSGIPLLQRLQGTKCWTAENFADLLSDPSAHCFPCDWPLPIRVDRRLKLDEPFQWEEYTFRLHPMNGHTRFSALIGFEADGKRFAHTGDQYFFQKGVEQFDKNVRSQNHVYRNGALLDGYDQSGKWMLDWRPDIVLTGHQPAMITDANFFRHINEWGEEYRALHRLTMPLEDEETHFNLDSWGGWIWPYRVKIAKPQAVTVRVTVRNPLPRAATISVRLVGPEGWTGTAATLQAQGRAEVSCDLQITPTSTCRRQPFAVELTVDGQPFGQVAEALMTVGGEEF